jgi:hypothetical protein
MAPVAAMVAPVFFTEQGSRVGSGVGVCGGAGESCGTGAVGKAETAGRARGSALKARAGSNEGKDRAKATPETRSEAVRDGRSDWHVKPNCFRKQ